MSEIRATTISNLAGTGPATLTKQSAAKAWATWSSTSAVFVESFNMSSYTDDGVGRGTLGFTSAFSGSGYAVSSSGNGNTTTASIAVGPMWNAAGTKSATVFSFVVYRASDFAFTDFATLSASFHGDLA